MKKVLLILGALVFFCVPVYVYASPLTGADDDLDIFWKYEAIEYTDDTADAASAGGSGDVAFPFSGGGMVYFGHSTSKFEKIVFDVYSASSFTGSSLITFEYWNGADWSELTYTSNTSPFVSTGVNNITFTAPSDWASTDVNGTSAYYIRINGVSGCDTNCKGATLDQISVLLVAQIGVPEMSDIAYLVIFVFGVYYLVHKTRSQAFMQR